MRLSETRGYGVELPADGTSEDWVFGNLFDDDMLAAIDGLPDKYRSAVILAYVEELSYMDTWARTDYKE